MKRRKHTNSGQHLIGECDAMIINEHCEACQSNILSPTSLPVTKLVCRLTHTFVNKLCGKWALSILVAIGSREYTRIPVIHIDCLVCESQLGAISEYLKYAVLGETFTDGKGESLGARVERVGP
jgi:hypothetical protein